MYLFENVILTDLDGVCVNWEQAFAQEMYRMGFIRTQEFGSYSLENSYSVDNIDSYIEHFNENCLSTIPPLRDSIKYIKKLHEEHGYVFHGISAVSSKEHIVESRKINLSNLFGPTTFFKVSHCETSERKHEFLEYYKNSSCVWIEDVVENAEMGLKYGLNPLLIEHHYNSTYTGPIKKVKTWKEIYHLIIG